MPCRYPEIIQPLRKGLKGTVSPLLDLPEIINQRIGFTEGHMTLKNLKIILNFK
jgi:hypothetical protein